MKNTRKRIVAVSMAAIMVLSGLMILIPSGSDDVEAADIPAGYIPITSATDLARVGTGQSYGGYSWTLAANYFLTTDIMLTGQNNHIPIGPSNSEPFTGTFDGNGKSITGLNFINSSLTRIGLFATIRNATIKNLNVEISVSSSVNSSYIGGILGFGYEHSVIDGCNTSGSISWTGTNTAATGGIAGFAPYIEITNCNNSATIYGGNNAGGILGDTNGASYIFRCSNTANVTAASSYSSGMRAGGIVGSQTTDPNARIRECFNTGTITAVSADRHSTAGGIVGLSVIINGVADCYNTGDIICQGVDYGVNSPTSGGGIVGRGGHADWELVNCYNTGNVSVTYGGTGSGSTCAGALVAAGSTYLAELEPHLIKGCYYLSSASVTGTTITSFGMPKTAAELKNQSTFVGWDFNAIWTMSPNGYPILLGTIKTIDITSSPVLKVVAGSVWSYIVVTGPSGAVISVESDLSLLVTGSTVYGTPTEPGTYTVTVTAELNGYESATQTFTITVVERLAFTSSPSAGYIGVG